MAALLPVFTTAQGEAEVLAAYDAVLDHWPVPYTELEVPTSFGETHLVVSGPDDGPPVVLLHAFFATAASWYRVVGGLSAGHRTFAVDVMGEANKSRPTRPIRSGDDYLQWFTELADGLGVSSLTLVGNSMGGFGAAFCAMHLPDRIGALALISPAATFHSIVPFYTHLFIPKAAYLFLPWLPGRRAVMRRCVAWACAGLPSDGPWGDLFLLNMIHGSSQTRLFPRVFTAAELSRIRARTLLVIGDREKVYPAGQAAAAAVRLLPTVQVHIIPGAHHIAAIARPDLVTACLLSFLADDDNL